MKHCDAKNNIQRKLSDYCTITELPVDTNKINIAIADMNGRYPEKGYAINHDVDELVHITSGNGTITLKNESIGFVKGDTILIERNEMYFWNGDFTATIACSPAFTAEQHEYIDIE